MTKLKRAARVESGSRNAGLAEIEGGQCISGNCGRLQGVFCLV